MVQNAVQKSHGRARRILFWAASAVSLLMLVAGLLGAYAQYLMGLALLHTI